MAQIKTLRKIAARMRWSPATRSLEMAENEQTTELTQEDQDWLDRIGLVIHGTKAIAQYMGMSPATIVRWRTRFRGREEFRLCFPAMLVPTGKGWGFRMIAHTALIKDWVERWAAIDAAKTQEKNRWRRRPKMKRIGETSKRLGAPVKEESGQRLHEDPPAKEERPHLTHEEPVKVESRPEPPTAELPGPSAPQRRSGIQRIEGCVCGSGLTCEAHGEPL
jgi:hypothetical protein